VFFFFFVPAQFSPSFSPSCHHSNRPPFTGVRVKTNKRAILAKSSPSPFFEDHEEHGMVDQSVQGKSAGSIRPVNMVLE